MIQYKSQHKGRLELFERRSLMDENSPFCEIEFRNTLQIREMHNSFQYSHICEPLTVC